MIEIRVIEKDNKELVHARNLYHNAFPLEERIDDYKLLKLLETQSAILIAIDEKTNQQVNPSIGYAYIIRDGSMSSFGYILYFAIDEEYRGKGIGTEFLCLLINSNMCSQFFLDIEDTGEAKASNKEERINRKAFYLKRGFCETSKKLCYKDCLYEILCTGAKLEVATLRKIFSELTVLDAEIEIIYDE